MKRCGSHNCAQAVICTYHDSSSVSYLPSSTDLVHGAYSVRLRNFARAAEACDVSQPTLSAMVQKLEEELDVRIFERTNKTVTTTAAGDRIIKQAKRSLMELERINEIVSEEKGMIDAAIPHRQTA